MIKKQSLLLILIKQYPFYIFVLTMMMISIIFLEMVAMLSLAPLIDLLIQPDVAQYSGISRRVIAFFSFLNIPFSLTFILGLFIGCHFLKVFFSTLQLKITHRINFFVTKNLINRTFGSIFAASWSFFSNKKGGEFMNLLYTHITSVGSTVVTLSGLFSCVIQILFYLYIPLRLSWQVSLLVIVCGGCSFGLLALASQKISRLSQENIRTSNQYLSFLNECLNSVKLIFSFAKQSPSIKQLIGYFSKNYQVSVRIQLLQGVMQQLYQPIGFLMVAIALIYARHIGIMMSNLTVLLYALVRIVPQLSQLAGLKLGLDQQLPYFHAIQEICHEADGCKQGSGKSIFTGFLDQIRLDNVSFSYLTNQPILKNISLTIHKNQMTALVGASGGGKSTLVDLISGFHQPQTGKILIDGKAFSHFDLTSYRQKVGYVMQDSPLFNMSVKQNLLWANSTATESELLYACEQANALDFIQALPNQFDTLLGERGVRLSGGQCQRVALARALIVHPEILILDEATSALDSDSELKIQNSIQALSGQMTVIVIAHRLSTIKQADQIFVIDDGVVVESGAYDGLMAMNQAFFEMVGKQAF